MKYILVVTLGILVAAWLALFLSSHGLLIQAVVIEHPPGGAQVLRCSYFTGLGFANMELWYSENNFMGRAICPRLYDFSN